MTAKQAERYAEMLRDAILAEKEAKTQRAALETALRDYCDENLPDGGEIGCMKAYTRAGSIKLAGASGKVLEGKIAQLLGKVDDAYVVTKPDITEMHKNLETDKGLVRALKSVGLEVEQSEPKMYFKHIQ